MRLSIQFDVLQAVEGRRVRVKVAGSLRPPR